MYHNILAILIKEFIHISRDRLTLIMMIAFPLFQLVIFGFAINTDVKDIPTSIFDQDRTQASRQLIKDFENTGYFKVYQFEKSEKAVLNSILNGHCQIGLVIPPNYSKNLQKNNFSRVQVLIDGSDSTIANQALNVSRAIGQNRSIEFIQKKLSTLLESKTTFQQAIDISPKMLFNPDLKSSYFMIPGLLGVIMQLITVMLTSFSIVRERENGNLEQLMVSPISPTELMIGKLFPYFTIGFLDMFLVILAMVFIFKIPIIGSVFLLIILSIFFIITSLSIGLLISTIAKNQLQAIQMTFLTFLPSIMLSGFMFPRESMPQAIYYMGYLVPLTYFIKVLRGIILRGVGIEALWGHIIPIIIFGIILMMISILRFPKQIQ